VPVYATCTWHAYLCGQLEWQHVGMPRQPGRRVRQALAAQHRAQEQLGRARDELHAAIVEALESGVRQADLVRLTGLSREHIRRIARAAGLKAA
jgi:hypothetical protein